MEKQQAIRVRVMSGPDASMCGRIGYLFDFSEDDGSLQSYIVTIDHGEVKKLQIKDGYEFEIEEL